MIAESLLVKQQLLILNRSRQHAPNLRVSDRILAGVCSLCMRPARVIRSAIVLKPSTILDFRRILRKRKYRLLFSPKRCGRTGPKGPSKELVTAIVEMKQRNPVWGCPRIAQQIGLAFDIQIDKDVVRRVLATHYRPDTDSSGPSWLTSLGHAKDSLCGMFNEAIRARSTPTYLSSDNDPLYRFNQWHANLRVLSVTAVKSVPYVPMSHPFVERLIGTLRRECLDRLLFWSAPDLEKKLSAFQDFYNAHRAHASLEGRTPVQKRKDVATLNHYRWKEHCSGLYQTPIAA